MTWARERFGLDDDGGLASLGESMNEFVNSSVSRGRSKVKRSHPDRHAPSQALSYVTSLPKLNQTGAHLAGTS